MVNQLSDFEKIDGLDGVWTAQKGTLRCVAFRLRDKSLCLFSPVAGLSDGAVKSLSVLGEVSFLLAPNHYHNKGILEYAEAYPSAQLIAPDDAARRLELVTGVRFSKLDALHPLLPPQMTLLHTAGLKTGEIWLRNEVSGFVAWIVVDAFCTIKENSKNRVTETPEILGTFPRMGVHDKAAYRGWVGKQIVSDSPKMIVPCHGSIIRSQDLPSKLTRLVAEKLG